MGGTGEKTAQTADVLNNHGEHTNPTLEVAQGFLTDSKNIKLNPAIQTFLDKKVKPFVENSGQPPLEAKPDQADQEDITQAFKDELNRRQTTGVPAGEGPATGIQFSHEPIQQAPAGSTAESPTGSTQINGGAKPAEVIVATTEKDAAIPPVKIPDATKETPVAAESNVDLDSMLASEKEKAKQERQGSWAELIKDLDGGNPNDNPSPFHLAFELDGKKAVVFIQPVKESATNPEAYFVIITPEGAKKILATKETKTAIYNQLLNPGDGNLKNLDTLPVSPDDEYNLTCSAVKDSAEKAQSIAGERKEISELNKSKANATELKSFIKAYLPSPAKA